MDTITFEIRTQCINSHSAFIEYIKTVHSKKNKYSLRYVCLSLRAARLRENDILNM